jgi:hypothetical protein
VTTSARSQLSRFFLSDRRPSATTLIAAAALVFAATAVRLPLLITRSPFFDELFTVWISRKNPSGVLEALRYDSGPPLYYFLTHLWSLLFGGTVSSLRVVSIIVAALTIAVVFRLAAAVEVRIGAALVLALWPAHVYFSTEARAYALCALLSGAGAIFLDRWRAEADRRSLVLGCLSLVGACWTHYYGFLFLPLLGYFALAARRRRAFVEATVAAGVMTLTVVPVLLLLREQPDSAMQWLHDQTLLETASSILQQLQFAAPYPAALMPPAHLFLRTVSILTVASLVGYGAVRSADVRRWLLVTLTPVVALLVLSAAGLRAYFPMRFESVLAVPFAVTLGSALALLDRAWLRRAAVAAIAACAAMIWGGAIRAFVAGPADPYREVAELVREKTHTSSLIVASGLSYLELEAQRSGEWSPRIVAFPSEQALHPGWRAQADTTVLDREASRLKGEKFIWVGEQGSPEARSLLLNRSHRLLAAAPPLVVVASDDRVNQLEQKHHSDPQRKEDADPGVVR